MRRIRIAGEGQGSGDNGRCRGVSAHCSLLTGHCSLATDHCMRIIAGRFKGRRLAAVRGSMRPTADRVREAVFNILGAEVSGARVLDLFAGSGALGIEALSRGAEAAVFVEQHPTALAVLRRNLELCGLTAQTAVLAQPVAAALRGLAAQGRNFTLVFCDPPYGQGLVRDTLERLGEVGLVAPGGLVAAEHSRRDEPAPEYGALARIQERRYGDTVVTFYRREAAG